MYMFEIHKDSKILYSSTHLSEGFSFSSATWKDIVKKQMSHHKNQNMWIIGTEMESGFDWNYSSLRF